MAKAEVNFSEIGGGTSGYTKSFTGTYSTYTGSHKTLTFQEIGFEPQVVIQARASIYQNAAYQTFAYIDLANNRSVDLYGLQSATSPSTVEYIHVNKTSDSIEFWQQSGSTLSPSYWIFLGN